MKKAGLETSCRANLDYLLFLAFNKNYLTFEMWLENCVNLRDRGPNAGHGWGCCQPQIDFGLFLV
jgi:hypothetical protein